MKLKIRKGDNVKVISGADKGKMGKVLEIEEKSMRITVEGVNIKKRAMKPTQKNPQGGFDTKERSIHYSNVMLTDKNGKATRVGTKRTVDAKTKKTKLVRVAKTTKEEIALPKLSK